jgi:hypothetical protein
MEVHMRNRMTGMAAGVLVACAGAAFGQVVAPQYAGTYSLSDLGPVPGVPTNYGGVTFLNNSTMLIGGAANQTTGAIYAIGVERDGNDNIVGFIGPATQFSTAPNIDGGLQFGPGGVLFYTGYSNNIIGQVKPGSTGPDKIIQLTPLGVAASTGSLAFVPAGFPGQGGLKIASYSAGTWYSATTIADGMGTYDLIDVTLHGTIGGGPEGIVYISSANPLFNEPAVLVSEYSNGKVVAYDIDANANPVIASKRDFITNLSGAEGAAVDPVTGQFVFSTFGGGGRVIIVRGFVPPECYANCDGSLGLNVADFSCFLQKFSAGDPYANCDGSTVPPVLNVADFTCFLTKFAAGCQ